MRKEPPRGASVNPRIDLIWWVREAGPERVGNQLRSVPHAGLGEDVVDVAFHGGLGDVKSAGNLGVRQACRDVGHHLGFAFAEAVRA